MSIDIIITVFYNEHDKSEHFVSLLKRLRARSFQLEFSLYEIVSGEQRKNYRTIDPIQNVGDVDRVFGLRREINVQMAFILRSGRTIPIKLLYTAKEFGGGYLYRDYGPLTIVVSLNDLARPLWESGGVETENALRNPELATAGVRDAEDLFFAACGAEDAENAPWCVKHGVMSADFGIVAPIGCSMVYHHEISDFLADYARTYCTYNFGTNPVNALTTDLDLWQLTPIGAETKRTGRLDIDLYHELFKPDGEQAICFMDSLEKSRLNLLKTQTSESIRDWFSSRDFTHSQIRSYDFPQGSFALTTYPLLTLWKAYAEFYDAITATC